MKKIGLISLAIVLALGSLGFAYAHWSDQLYIEGTVKGGQLMVGFTEILVAETHVDPVTGNTLQGEYLGKDVGKVTWEYADWRYCDHSEKGGYQGALVTINDAYPCYQAHITFVVDNLGTIPVIFEGVTITDPSGQLEYDDVLEALVDPVTREPIINFTFVNLIELQLEPCHNTKAEVDVHLKQEAEQCHQYTFRVDIDAIQYNKSAYWSPVP